MKILLITHNPICTNNNMGKTFLSLFSEFENRELCQLYVHPTLPDVSICNSYYRITDKEALKSIFTFDAPGGEVVCSKVGVEVDSNIISIKNKKSYLSRLGRDFVWKLSHWYSGKLKAWLDREAPTHIFLAPGYAKFIYDIALKISRDRRIPIVTYICDDYYFVIPPTSLLGKLQLSLLRRKTEALMEKTACLVAICDEIKDLYGKSFGVRAETVMTGADMPCLREVDRVPTSISYFGNIGCNRYLSLHEVGRTLEKINRRKGTSYMLKVYTNEQDSVILDALSSVSTIRMCGFFTGEAFREAMKEADLLLHTEAFDPDSIDLVKHSVSTKIADSLSTGIPLIAYVPAEVSSAKHLQCNECAFIATSSENLSLVLEQALTDSEMRRCVVSNALRTAAVYHNKKKNSAILRSAFIEIGKGNS